MARVPVVGIVGGGLAGALVAAHLLRLARSPVRVVVVERRGEIGRGIAYSTSDDVHLLNVPMERMSAFCDQPSHFAARATVAAERPPAPGAFLPRRLYGDYVREALAEQERRAQGGVLERKRGEVVDLQVRAGAQTNEMVLASGERVACDYVVLALGNLPSARPAWLIDDPRVVGDPWAPASLEPRRDGTTLLVGTGLTAVDVTLSLCRPGTTGKVVAVSTGGRLPFAQLVGDREAAPPPIYPAGPLALDALMRQIADHLDRMRAEGYDWRDVIDGLRPRIPDLWRMLSASDRRRFADQHSRAWELRRHRMAPAAAARVRELRAQGRLTLLAGRVTAARPARDGIEVDVSPSRRSRGAPARTLTANRLVACTGPCTDVARTPDTLAQRLLVQGLACPDPLGLGLRCGPRAELLDAAGRPRERVRLIGPPLRGELWETTAAAEIRAQAEQLASELCGVLGVARPAWARRRTEGR